MANPADRRPWCGQWSCGTKTGPAPRLRCLVYRDDWDRPANGTVKWSSDSVQTFQPKRGGDRRPTKTWATMPSHMLGKVAESLALRRAFAEVAAAVAYMDDDDTALTHEVAADAWVADIAPPGPPEEIPPPAPSDGVSAAPAVEPAVAELEARLYALPDRTRAFFRAWRRSRGIRTPDRSARRRPGRDGRHGVAARSGGPGRRGGPSGMIRCDGCALPIKPRQRSAWIQYPAQDRVTWCGGPWTTPSGSQGGSVAPTMAG